MQTKVYKSELSELQLKYKKSNYNKMKISSSSDLFNAIKPLFNQDTIGYSEESIVLYLNTANNTLGYLKHSSGGTSQTVVDLKTIISVALLAGSCCIAFSHNHPSGQLFPSQEDIRITDRMKKACETVGLRFLDHIIVSGDDDYQFYSFSDEGKI